ncbi:MAG: hypothetical protein AAGA77_25190 [Bacteroidota bacterium]
MKHVITLLLLSLITSSYAQIENDDCQFAIFLPQIDEFCSESGEFTNAGAQPDPLFSDVCFLSYQNGVWFSFIPKEPALNIRVFGEGVGENTLGSPKVALFNGCGDYLNCSPENTSGVLDFSISNLEVGTLHYLMVESNIEMEGEFQLCINDFTPMPTPSSDCINAVVLCNKDPFIVENLNSAGDDPSEANGSCIGGESASSWYVWQCAQNGTLTLELTPANLGIEEIVDDLDFIIYEFPGGIGDCENRIELRCMGSGANVSSNGMLDDLSTWALCNRATGMKDGETDVTETGGCLFESNNYVAPLEMVSGRTYGMIVNNFSNTGLGFSVEFGGTGTFVGPESDFAVEATSIFECEEEFVFIDLSDAGVDQITNYSWNFGDGANPASADGPGPHSSVFESFGHKTASLTLETNRGCLVTKTLEFYLEPCCDENTILEVNGSVTNVPCFGSEDGEIHVEVSGGNPNYSYSLDGINFQPNPIFLDLKSGDYEVVVVDEKGCMVNVFIDLAEPEQLLITLVEDEIVISGGVPPYEILSDQNVGGVRIITIIDANGCISTAELIQTHTLDKAQDQQISLFPNPVQELLQIRYGNSKDSKGTIQLLDLQG